VLKARVALSVFEVGLVTLLAVSNVKVVLHVWGIDILQYFHSLGQRLNHFTLLAVLEAKIVLHARHWHISILCSAR